MNPVKLSKAGTIQAARLLALLASLLLLNACDGPPQASDTTKDVEAPKEKTPIVEVAPTSEPTPESQTTPATPVEPAPKPIQANEPIEFTFRRVPTGQGDAMLRLSFGREHGTTRKPDVRFNNQPLDMPDDWAGDDQLGRTTFFGMLEIAVPIDLIHRTNTISITFPDSGGKVACAVLQTNLVGR